MDSIAVAFLTLLAILVGMFAVIMVQLHSALRRLEGEISETRRRIEPMLDRLGSSHLATSVAMAVAAGVRAYREAHKHQSNHQSQGVPHR